MKLNTENYTTLDQIEQRINSGITKMIYYGANTCWWTDNAQHCYRTKDVGLPCDPRSGVLFEADDPVRFIQSARDNVEHYGKHGLKAFEAAYHGNVLADNGKPTCFTTWDRYNDLLDVASSDPNESKDGGKPPKMHGQAGEGSR